MMSRVETNAVVMCPVSAIGGHDAPLFEIARQIEAKEQELDEVLTRYRDAEIDWFADPKNKALRRVVTRIGTETDAIHRATAKLVGRLNAHHASTFAGLKLKARYACSFDKVADSLARDVLLFSERDRPFQQAAE